MAAHKRVDLIRPARTTRAAHTNGRRSSEAHEVWARLTLPPNVELVSQRWTAEGWSGSFTYYGQECFTLRERNKGTIECEYRPFNSVSGSLGEATRTRTGHKELHRALDAAIQDYIHPEHEKRVIRGPLPLGKTSGVTPDPVADLGLEDIAILVRNLGLLSNDARQGAKEDRVLDLACAIWNNTPLQLLGNKDIEHFYSVRRAGFEWPRRFHTRPPLSQSPKNVTIQQELKTLSSVVNRLVAENHPVTGNPYLSSNRLEQLNLGHYAKAQRPEAHPDRYAWTYHAADESVEAVRARGVDHSYHRRDHSTGASARRTHHRSMANVIPGITRMMLVLQYGHGMRPGSWRHIKVDADLAANSREVLRLIRSLELLAYDEQVKESWARVWTWGAIAYRRAYFKGKHDYRYERIVPLSEKMLAELRLYLRRRDEWLRKLGVTSCWLFPSPTDPSKPIHDHTARDLLYAAEEFARSKAEQRRGARYVVEVLEDLKDTAWYAYRRAWKTLRNGLGWASNKNANYCGGWSTKSGQVSEVVYARLMPEFLLAVVEGLSVVEAVKKYAETEVLKAQIDVAPERLPDAA